MEESGLSHQAPADAGVFERLRLAAFAATGLAIPLYAFPVARVWGKPLDLATIFALLFLVASLPDLAASWRCVPRSTFCAGVALIPLAVLMPPRPELFAASLFARSYAHWLLVTGVFAAALSLRLTQRDRERLARINWGMGIVVAVFALYQVFGIPKHWPGTGPLLSSFQREPFRLYWIGGYHLASSYTRPTSFFLESAWMGGYLCWVMVLAIALTLARRGTGGAGALFLRSIGVCLLVLAILASVSWGAYVDLAIVAVSLILALVVGVTPRRYAAIVFLVLLVLSGASLLTPAGGALRSAIRDRWTMLRTTPTSPAVPRRGRDFPYVQDSSWSRVQNLRFSLELFRSHPWRGVGLGESSRYAERTRGSLGGAGLSDPWCGWAALAAEAGAVAPLVLAGALLLVATRGLRPPHSALALSAPILALLALVQQLHTGSYIDLWWWYPVSLGGALAGPFRDPGVKTGILRQE